MGLPLLLVLKSNNSVYPELGVFELSAPSEAPSPTNKYEREGSEETVAPIAD